jgi:MoaA/NifB/PqqE/SkfB family radical SAM enzyme
MCGIEGIRQNFDELKTESFPRVAAQLRAVGARHVVITGGEPFLRHDLADIVEAFARLRFSVRIQTNGGPQVTRDRIAAVARAGASDLSVSVDTLDGSTQDWITGGQGALAHALRTLDWAIDAMPDGMSLANIVASPHNFAQLPGLVRYFGGRGIYTYVTPAVVTAGNSGGHLFRGRDASFGCDGIEAACRDAVIDELIAQRRAGLGLTNSTRHLQDFRQFIATGRSEWTCHSGVFTLDVRPDGSVSACKEKPSIAHVLSPEFVAVYRSDAFRELAAAQGSACSGCFYGEYREPFYAIGDASVLMEWVWDWLRTFRRGMNGTRSHRIRSRREAPEHVPPAP